MDIGRVVILLREKKQISQSELANLIGITQPSLSNIESGKKKPHKSTISKICEAMEIPEQFLYFLATEPEDLPVSGRERFKQAEKGLKKLILSTIKS
ncbi:helix-turn-helix domain-containing protein [Desertivirga xinjiangensis]|uniref:helix-turn-helix domain-containing protein n=1 Tax=Desertivirga xinjiangensis TaxID=539206 RepID=UPI00210A5FB1|nr:helix-turn-helix transcriptional regulator [Pedobacter xinjiangensis]